MSTENLEYQALPVTALDELARERGITLRSQPNKLILVLPKCEVTIESEPANWVDCRKAALRILYGYPVK